MGLGEVIRKYREAKGVNITKLAQITGISRSYLSQIESGAKGPPSLKVLLRIGEALEMPTAEIVDAMEGEDYPKDCLKDLQDHSEINKIVRRTYYMNKDSADSKVGPLVKNFAINFLEDKQSNTIEQLNYNPILIENILIDLLKMGEQGQIFVKKQVEVYKELFMKVTS